MNNNKIKSSLLLSQLYLLDVEYFGEKRVSQTPLSFLSFFLPRAPSYFGISTFQYQLFKPVLDIISYIWVSYQLFISYYLEQNLPCFFFYYFVILIFSAFRLISYSAYGTSLVGLRDYIPLEYQGSPESIICNFIFETEVQCLRCSFANTPPDGTHKLALSFSLRKELIYFYLEARTKVGFILCHLRGL